jgi:hypothetical protein
MKAFRVWLKSWRKFPEYLSLYFALRRLVNSRISALQLTSRNRSKKLTIATSYITFVSGLLADTAGVPPSFFLKSEFPKIWTDLYILILIFDDEIDISESSGENKAERLKSFFSTIYSAMHDLQLFKEGLDGKTRQGTLLFKFIESYEAHWEPWMAERLATVIRHMEQEWILEGLPENSRQALASLHSVPKTSVDIIATSVEIFYKRQIPEEALEAVYSVSFIGNMLDDFVDYFITGEDWGKPCYVELRKAERELHWGRWSNLFAALSLYYQIVRSTFMSHLAHFTNERSGWIIPLCVRFVCFTGPLNVLSAFIHRSDISSTILEANAEPIGASRRTRAS